MIAQQTQTQSQIIPLELIPYFEAIVDLSKKKPWATTIYNQTIIPYLDRVIRTQTFENNTITLDELSLLKAYFGKNKQSLPKSQREKLIHLQNAIKISDALARDIEYSFFINVARRRSGFDIDSYLPDTFSKHLRSILEIQLLLFIELELIQLKNRVDERKRLEFYHWVRKELDLKKTPHTPENRSKTYDFSQVGPSYVYYFFNGAQHLFLLCQLEFVQLKAVAIEWSKWKEIFKKERLALIDFITLVTVPTAKFLFYLFCLSLLPYRILRTVVNQFSNYCAAKLQDVFLKYFAHLAKKKLWISFNILFQISLYTALILGVGLPLFPLPLVWIPDLVFSKLIFMIPILYSASIFACGRLSRLWSKNQTENERGLIHLENQQRVSQRFLAPSSGLINMHELEQRKTTPIDSEHIEARKKHSKLSPR